MQDFRKLKVWQKAHALTLAVYRETRSFPSDERYGITSQLRRSGASIASNISEGCAVPATLNSLASLTSPRLPPRKQIITCFSPTTYNT